MTHKQIWTEIALALHTPESEGTQRQRDLATHGLCYAQGGYDNEDNTTGRFICSLNNHSGFWFPTRLSRSQYWEHDLIRGDMAALFACMTEKEFNELVAPQVPTK